MLLQLLLLLGLLLLLKLELGLGLELGLLLGLLEGGEGLLLRETAEGCHGLGFVSCVRSLCEGVV